MEKLLTVAFTTTASNQSFIEVFEITTYPNGQREIFHYFSIPITVKLTDDLKSKLTKLFMEILTTCQPESKATTQINGMILNIHNTTKNSNAS
jgi:hypothetical protein